MQAVVAVPPSPVLSNYADGAGVLERPAAGVPLLTRVIATAGRAGADSVLLIWPRDVDESIWQRVLESPLLKSMPISRLVEAFDPAEAGNWAAIELALEDRFLWLPWNWVTHKRALTGLAALPAHPALWEAPVLLDRHVAASRNGAQLAEQALKQAVEGVALLPHTETAEAERFLVAHSGKPSDGIYSRFNRWLCRPAVRFLSHTRVTPNWITLGGLLLTIPAALLYARGFYAAYVGGALLFFLSGLFDEMDGMLARIEFRESVFGTWFEGLVDEGTYLLLFWGITAGLYRQRGPRELIYGSLLIAGCALSIAVTRWQRKLATAPDRPHEYAGRLNSLLDSDASNLVSRVARHIQVFIKKGAAVHYVVLFTVLGGLPWLLRLAALGANLTWVVTLYFNRRFFRRGKAGAAAGEPQTT